MEDLFNLLILAVFFLLSAAFGKKKRPGTGRGTAGSQSTTASRSRPPTPSPSRRPAPRAPSTPEMEPPVPRSQVQDIFEMLRREAEARAEMERAASFDEIDVEDAYSLEEEPEIVSLETLEGAGGSRETLEAAGGSRETLVPAGGASHTQFHDMYIRPLEDPQPDELPHFAVPQGPMSLRKAVIWQEILGEPKGLRR